MLDALNQSDGQISHALADLTTGTVTFDGMDHETRIMRLTALIELHKAAMTYGELEHTSDWDWRVEIVDVHGNVRGTTETSWSDTIILEYTTEPNDYMDRFARWQYLIVEEFSMDDSDDQDVLVLIDDILTITFGLA